MILEKDDSRQNFCAATVALDVLPNRLGEFQTWIAVGDQNGFRTAADHFVREYAALSKQAGLRRAQQTVDRDRVGVSDKIDPWQREQPRVKHRFHRRLSCAWIDSRVEQRLIDRGIGYLVPIEQCQKALEAALRQLIRRECSETAAARLDQKRVLADARRRIAFAKNREPPFLASEFMRQREEGLRRGETGEAHERIFELPVSPQLKQTTETEFNHGWTQMDTDGDRQLQVPSSRNHGLRVKRGALIVIGVHRCPIRG